MSRLPAAGRAVDPRNQVDRSMELSAIHRGVANVGCGPGSFLHDGESRSSSGLRLVIDPVPDVLDGVSVEARERRSRCAAWPRFTRLSERATPIAQQ
jgi:hypothetical protein